MSEGAGQVLPTGTVTLLLADVEGSTRAWEDRPEETRRGLARLDEVVDAAVATHSGVRPVEQGEGDSFVAAFARASDALAAAVEIQRGLVGSTLRLRIALHTGEVQLRDEGNYVGPALNRAARLRDAAHGGQVVLSQVANDLVTDALSDDLILRDLGSHRLRDLGRPEHVFQVVHPGLAADFPALRSLDHVPNNLPVQLTTFVGREAELAVLRKLVGGTRLLTLTGAGGCGKTRLALELAAGVLDRRRDGVWFVDLAPVSDPKAVPSAVASAVGSQEQTGRRVLDVLLDRFLASDAVLVLDNCEHVVEAAAALAESLLLGCPGLTIVATSREQLGVTGETPWLVPSLSVPPERAFARADGLVQYEAVQLFVDRARRARPDVAVNDEAAAAMAGICQRLDGIPLAIELAAARTRVLSLAQILDDLDDRFRLLTGGARTAVPRHQTLRASVDWSYQLLSPHERILLDRLSVFAGGFTLDAAETVAGGAQPLAEHDVLDLMQSLVDKSLVSADLRAPVARYRMLETIRQYAAEHLSSSEEEAAVRDRHRVFFLDLAEQAGPLLETSAQATWADRLEDERENLRAAFDWAASRGDGETLLRFVAALYWFWVLRGHLGEGRRLYKRAFALKEGVAPGVVATALAAAAHLSLLRFDDEGASMAREALDAARAAGDPRTEGRARYLLGWAEGFVDADAGFEDLDAGIAIAREVGDRWGLLMALTVSGMFHHDEPNQRIDALHEALAIAEELGERYIANSARYSLARPLLGAGRTAEGEALLRAVVAHARTTGDTYSLTMALPDLGSLRAVQGDLDEGLRLVEENAALFEANRLPWLSQQVQCYGCLASVLEMAGRHDEALTAGEKSVEASRRLDLPDILGLSLAALALSQQSLGDAAAARGHADEAIAALATARPSWAVASAKHSLARLLWAQGEGARAQRLAHDALTINVELRCHYLMRGTVYVLETLAMISEDPSCSARLLGAVDTLLSEAGHVRSPNGEPDYGAAVTRLRAELGDEDFGRAYEEGGRLTLDAAVDYARRGRGPRKRPSTGWESLTPTELEVAGLVAEGLSNPQIAERMFISRKTVTTHLSHVFAKLGVPSRAALSAEVTRRGFEGET